MNTMLNLSSSPHVRDRWTTAYIMRVVLLALLPATLVGVIHFGIHALLVVLLSVFTAVLCELVFDKLCHKPDTWKDGSEPRPACCWPCPCRRRCRCTCRCWAACSRY